MSLKQLVSWSGQLFLIPLLWLGISYWQNKDLIENAVAAPTFTLRNLNDDALALGDIRSERTLVYFFAPWCRICKLSIGNLNELNADRSLAVVAVALSYESPAEVARFVADQELEVPVLLGTDQTLSDFKIELFPTYYMLDQQKRVTSKSVGYSTELGLRARSWW